MEVELWRTVTNIDFRRRAPALVLQMVSTALDVYMAMGGDKHIEPGVPSVVRLLGAGRLGRRLPWRGTFFASWGNYRVHGRIFGQVRPFVA